MKFTFKRAERPTGLRSVGYRDSYDIKLQKKVVGRIYNGGKDIRFAVVKDGNYDDGNPNCTWMWVKYGSANSFEDAKKLVNDYIKDIQFEYELHKFED